MDLYLNNAICISKITTKLYSTSFSMGVRMLDPQIRNEVYAIYGFVRFADEIVDTFPLPPEKKRELLSSFKADTLAAIENKISTNPIIHSFQHTVNKYHIPVEIIEAFLHSMEMDLEVKIHTEKSFQEYIYGSASAVGLMCLCVFTDGDKGLYDHLRDPAIKLGEAFQKVNFLRDIKSDFELRGRSYFPDIDLKKFDNNQKKRLEDDILTDFETAKMGIRQLPLNARFGVYLAYRYFWTLTQKISKVDASNLFQRRIRISNLSKLWILKVSILRHWLRWYK